MLSRLGSLFRSGRSGRLSATGLPYGRDTILHLAIALSVIAHAVVLAIRFVPPDALRFKPDNRAIEVILVNARSQEAPVKADALAQSNLSGGGEQEKGRVTSFLPRSARVEDGDALEASRRAVAQLEEQQRKLLSQMRSTPQAVAPEPAPQPVEAPPAAPLAPLNVRDTVKAIARMEAQLDKQINDYNARPRRGYIGPNTRGVSYAMYYNQWKDKVERVGTLNYPEEARGKLYGELVLVVTLNFDGTIYNDEIQISRSSGYPVLDRAAARIVRLAAPYGRFAAEMRKDYDVFEIITKFTFTRGDGFEARVQK